MVVHNSKQQIAALQQQLRLNLQHCPPVSFLQECVRQQYPEQLQRVQELLSRAVQLGESNSALIVGPRGVGKSAVARVALSQLSDSSSTKGNAPAPSAAVLVQLHGNVHTDDSLALREIARQLRLEESVATKTFNSFAENLSFLLSSLRSEEQSKVVVFVLDEFDLFCHHRNQTLLYNLFDVAQSAQSPICVLGLTCRLDVVDGLLEKRVRSRFSHRQISLYPPKLEDYYSIAQHLLTVAPNTALTKATAKEWNNEVAELLEDEDVTEAMDQLHAVTRDIATLRQMLQVSVSCVKEQSPVLEASHITHAISLMLADATPTLLQGLSTLQLSLIIAMMHLTKIYEGQAFNFELVLNEYLKFSRRRSSVQGFERPVVFKAFDQLRSVELVTPYDTGSRSSVQKEYQMMRLQLPCRLLQDTLTKMTNLPTDLLQWAGSALA